MLVRQQILRPQDKIQWLDQFSPQKQTWLVSDLKSKLQIQRRLLARHQAIEEVAVLRASEMWRRLLWHHYPEQRLVSMDLVRTIIQRELRTQNINWAKGPGAAHTLTQLMPQFLPLLAQLDDPEMVSEWLKENPDSLLKWGHWYELARRVWQVFENEALLPAAWAPAYLLSHLHHGKKLTWPKSILVDLSAQLTSMEESLFEHLGQNGEVILLQPKPKWAGAFTDLNVNMTFSASEKSILPTIEELRVQQDFRIAHFSTPLAEVKDAVAQVRIWLDQGVKPEAIAIAAPEIETYWPLLAPTLEQEGIPVDKARTIPLHSLPAVQEWMAILRLKIGRVDSADLELAAFCREEGAAAVKGHAPHKGFTTLSYDRFKRLFTNLYNESQLAHSDFLQAQFGQELDPDEILTRDEFTLRVCRWWHGNDIVALERLVKQLLEDSPPNTRLTTRLWLDWLEAWTAKIEITVTPAVVGVHAVNLMAAEWLPLKNIYLLGLSEENLRDFNIQGLSTAETQKIFNDLGVPLPSSERAPLEFEARWLLDRDFVAGVLSCAVTDPAGNPLTPSRIWLLQNEDAESALKNLSAPAPTRWDEVQNAQPETIASLRDWPQVHMKEMLDSLSQDLGLSPLPEFAQGQVQKLSPSALESYSACPFVFAAEKLFLLSDLPPADLDLDPMTRGSLIHKIFEVLTVEPRRFDWNVQELGQIVDEARQASDLPDFGLWPQLRQRFIEQAQRFLTFEEQWHKKYPATRTLARELNFKMGWSQEQKGFIPTQNMAIRDLAFSGRIDRVDSDQSLPVDGSQEYAIIDYKSSLAQTVTARNWLEKDAFQLALYIEAIESGMTELPPGKVRGAFYYSAKDFDRLKGLQVNGENRLLPDKGRSTSAVSDERKSELLLQLRRRMAELIGQINNGQFAPRPKDVKNCLSCNWRDLCRAPHLH